MWSRSAHRVKSCVQRIGRRSTSFRQINNWKPMSIGIVGFHYAMITASAELFMYFHPLGKSHDWWLPVLGTETTCKFIAVFTILPAWISNLEFRFAFIFIKFVVVASDWRIKFCIHKASCTCTDVNVYCWPSVDWTVLASDSGTEMLQCTLRLDCYSSTTNDFDSSVVCSACMHCIFIWGQSLRHWLICFRR